MMFVVPEANTPEERAAAGGMPFNAKEVVDRVKRQYAERQPASGHREWRRKQRQWRRAGLVGRGRRRAPPWLVAVLPLFGLVHLILFLIAAGMMISLVNTGAILSWQKPPDVPLWAAPLVLFIGLSDRRLAVPGRAALDVALRRRCGGRMVRVLARGHLADRPGDRALGCVGPHPGDHGVHAAPAAPVPGSDVRGA